MSEIETFGGDKARKKTSCLAPAFIVVVVILILAAIAIPDFLKFCGPRDKFSEAKTNLGAIFTSMTAYFGEHATYAGGDDCFGRIGFGPEGDTLYNYYCGDSVIPCTKLSCSDCGGVTALGLKPVSSNKGFTIYAVGNIDRDTGDCDVWSMNDAKNLRRVKNDQDEKWWKR